MELAAIHSKATVQIQSVAPKTVTINDCVYHRSLIVLPDRLIEDWPIATIESLNSTNAQALVELHPEVLLIGTGATLVFPKPELMAFFKEKRIGVEFMDTAAACRTFQLLTTENRAVVAALIL